jgi:hypothetical protein
VEDSTPCAMPNVGEVVASQGRVPDSPTKRNSILSLVEKMKLKEGLNAAQAASLLQISPSVISRWAQKKDTIQASNGKKLSMSPGYNGLLKGVELGWKFRRHVGDKAKCRPFLSRQANFGNMVFSVSANFCVVIF